MKLNLNRKCYFGTYSIETRYVNDNKKNNKISRKNTGFRNLVLYHNYLFINLIFCKFLLLLHFKRETN